MFFQGNNAEDGGGPRASLERLTPQQIGLLALICVFVLIAIVTVVAFLIWACVVLFETYPSISEVCNSEAPVWLFCIICLTVMVLSLATGAAKDMDGNLTYYSYVRAYSAHPCRTQPPGPASVRPFVPQITVMFGRRFSCACPSR
eukprot:460740-Rhodomonas_salina.2